MVGGLGLDSIRRLELLGRSELEDALDRGGKASEAERLAVAASNTWDARVARLDEWLAAAVASKR